MKNQALKPPSFFDLLRELDALSDEELAELDVEDWTRRGEQVGASAPLTGAFQSTLMLKRAEARRRLGLEPLENSG